MNKTDKKRPAQEVPVQEQSLYTEAVPKEIADEIELEILKILERNAISYGLCITLLSNVKDRLYNNSFIKI